MRLFGENGLIQRAKQASEVYRKAEEEESNGIEKLIDEMGKASGENGETEPSPDPAETPEPEPTPTPGELAEDLNDKVEGEQAGDVLGKNVEGLGLASGLKEQYTWQIFDVDSEHIYLISTNYINIEDCPQKGSYSVTQSFGYPYKGALSEVINEYARSGIC